MCVCVCVYIYIYTYIYIYIYTHTCIYMYTYTYIAYVFIVYIESNNPVVMFIYKEMSSSVSCDRLKRVMCLCCCRRVLQLSGTEDLC